MIRIGPSIRPKYFPAATVDPDAQAFITAAGITDATQQSAINTLVTDLKGYGIWTKMKAIYPFVGGTSSTHKWNLKDPRDLDAAFRLVFSGGWTHSSTGANPNGTNGYADTFLTPSTSGLSVNSNAISFYSGSNLAETIADPTNMGVFIFSGQAMTLVKQNATLASRLNGGAISYSTATMRGFFSASRQSATLTDVYLNGSQVGTGNSGGILPDLKLFIGTINNGGVPYSNGYVKNDFRFASIGDGLTDTEAANLSITVEKYQTTLGRSVNPWYDNGNLLLDLYPSASAAYSTRKLRNYYIGAAIRVRRSSDNAEQDIYFDVNGNLDESALTTFVGANNGFVTTWYDQSGNNRNMTQSTAANQPQIVSSGVVIKENAKPSIQFDGSNDNLFNTTTGFTVNNLTHYVVSTRDTTGVIQSIFSTGILAGGSIGFGFNYTDTNLLQQQTRDLTTNVNSGAYSNTQGAINLISSINTSSAINTYYNGANNVNTAATLSGNSNTYITFGARYNTLNFSALFLNGKISEYVFWQNNLSSNISDIHTNINTYFSIY